MRGQLGEYVHLHTENYRMYGIQRKGSEEGDYPGLRDAYIKQKTLIQKKIYKLPEIDDNSLQELKKRVKTNIGEEKNAQISSLFTMKQDSLKEVLEKKIAEGLQNISFKTHRKELSKIIKGKSSLKNDFLNESKINIEKAQAAYKRLIENSISTINTNFKEKKPIQPQTINAFNQNFNEVLKHIGVAEQQLKDIIKLTKHKKLQNHNFFNSLTILLQSLSLGQVYGATLQGKVGEATIALCDDCVKDQVDKEMSELFSQVKSKIKGQDSSFFQRKEKQIQLKDKDGHLYQLYKTSDKVDVIINVEEKPLQVSVKNYTSQGKTFSPHLQDINLLDSLSTMKGIFANHWINIHSIKESLSLPEGLSKFDIDGVLEKHMMYEALVSGNLLKQRYANETGGAQPRLANTFVAIDSKKGKVFVQSTKKILLEQIENNEKNTYFHFYPKIDSLYFNNTKASDPKTRILNILSQIRLQKIGVSLSVPLEQI